MQNIRLQLSISPEEYLKFYRGQARSVTARALDGRRVRFPAEILKPYVTREGVHGLFLIRFSDEGKFAAIEKLPV